MIETNEYRVRPVVRYVVTHYHSYSTEDGKGGGGGSEVVGEFDNEAQAEKVKAALEDTTNGYVIFKRSFEVPTELYYAQTLEEAKAQRNVLCAHASDEWLIAKRVA